MFRVLFILFVYIVRFSVCEKCLCTRYCSERNTVGYEHYGDCYYIRHNDDLRDWRSSEVTDFRNASMIQLFRFVASEFRKRFNVNVVSLGFQNIQRKGQLGTNFALPTYPLRLIKCSAIYLKEHILFDEYPFCGLLSSKSKFYKTSVFRQIS